MTAAGGVGDVVTIDREAGVESLPPERAGRRPAIRSRALVRRDREKAR